MNRLKKIYCRGYQTAFKLSMPILPYRNPRIYDSVEKIPFVLKEEGLKNVLIVTDKVIRGIDAFKKLEDALLRESVKYTVFDETVANPTVEVVEKARAVYIEKGCDALIGFGGGSAIDCAKAVGARIARKKLPIRKMRGILKIIKPLPFLIAVPTTAGTGSEVTVTMVITDENTHEKFPISDFCLIPRVAVLDPETTKTLPKAIVSTTGMDALTHAVEAYIGNSTNKATRRDAIEALELILGNLKEAYENSENANARKNMLNASFLAGRAFSKSYVGYCHAVAHTLGGRYNIPHGLANAVLLPYVLRRYGESCYKKLYELSVALKLCDKKTDEKKAAELFIEKIEKMNEEMNIPKKLLGIKSEDVSIMAENADKEANPLYPVPRLMDTKELEKFYFDVMEEKND